MIIKSILDEDFINYKMPSMYIAFPKCNFKCCIENDLPIRTCQNCDLMRSKDIETNATAIAIRYLENPITKAIVMAGMEPLDTFSDVIDIVSTLRQQFNCNDTIVIYTGWNRMEVLDKVQILQQFPNIIIKFGRFVPNQEPHLDLVLGVQLASNNQYAEQIS